MNIDDDQRAVLGAVGIRNEVMTPNGAKTGYTIVPKEDKRGRVSHFNIVDADGKVIERNRTREHAEKTLARLDKGVAR